MHLKNKFMCLMVLFLYFTIYLQGQTQTIYVVDRATNQPLPFVQVIDSLHGEVLESDNQGIVVIPANQGGVNLDFHYVGYKSVRISLTEAITNGRLVRMEAEALPLEEIVVSANRWSQSSGQHPYRIHTLNPKNTWQRQPQTAADLLGSSGRVFIQKSQQGGGSPMIRGFATNRLVYTVDGVRMNTAIFRAGNIQNIINLDGFSLEKAEILFGPGSVMYGSDAIGGVMSFQTLQPILSADKNHPVTEGQSVIRHSTANNELTVHADFKAGNTRFGSVTSISANRFGDLKTGRHGPADYLKPYLVIRIDNRDSIIANPEPEVQSPSAYNQLNVMQKFLWKMNRHNVLEYGFHYSTTSTYDRYDRHIRYINGLPRYGEWQYGPQSWMMHLLTWHHNQTSRFFDKWTLRTAYQRFGESRIDRDINAPVRHIRKEAVDAYSLNIDFLKTLGQNWLLTYGGEGIINTVHSSGINTNVLSNFTEAGPARYPQALWSTAAAFASAQYKASKRWSMHAGLRTTLYSLDAQFDTTFYPLPFTESRTFKSALTGNVGTVFRPSDKTILQASLSTGFRAPNVDDMGKIFDSAPGQVTVPNPGLKAEYAWNAEISMTRLISSWARVDLSVYTTRLNHGLVKRPFTLNGLDSLLYDGQLSRIEAVQNAAFVKVRGLQAGIDLQVSKKWMITSQYNIQRGIEELEDGSISPARQAAPDFGSSQVIWRHSRGSIMLLCQYSAGIAHKKLSLEEQAKPELYAKDADGLPFSPSWMIWSINSTWQLTKRAEVFIGIENIANIRYRPYSSGMAGAGRQLIATFRTSW